MLCKLKWSQRCRLFASSIVSEGGEWPLPDRINCSVAKLLGRT